jgi:S-layer protein
MAYTTEQLVQAYTAVHDGVAPDAAAMTRIQFFVAQSVSYPNDTQALNYIINSADDTTSLAALSYQFFTGKSPTKAGLDYLVHSADNGADLNDGYYSAFNIENRYINFSANLGVQGEGAAAFATKYGSMTFAAYVASIYETIIGSSYATAAGIDPAKAIADIVSRQAAILATAQGAGMIKPGATAAQIDIALKAATAGYLLGEAIKADVGVYASSANNFAVALATGTAVYNTDITQTYSKPAGQTGGLE